LAVASDGQRFQSFLAAAGNELHKVNYYALMHPYMVLSLQRNYLELIYILQHDSVPGQVAITMQKFLREGMLSEWSSELWAPIFSAAVYSRPKKIRAFLR
jgi:hypothetical protein